MRIKEMYEYAYYQVYKSMILSTDWGADWRASGVYIVFQAFIFWSLIIYYELIFPYHHPVSFIWFILPGIIVYIIDYYVLHHKEQWKEIVKRYDAWPQKKNFRGTLIVWGIISLVVANFFIAITLYDNVN